MGKVLCLGELLFRISPDLAGTWLTENNLPFYIGGAELNVATALSLWGIPSAYFTALPKNFIGDELVHYLERHRIDAAQIQRSGDRIGIYYLPKGKDLKNAGVVYDRANSAFSMLQPNTINWDEVLKDITWLHFSAISPALNESVADICLEAVRAAKRRKISISIDLNYREKLWNYGKQAIEVVPELVSYCDLIMGNIWAAEKMLDIPITNLLNGEMRQSAYLAQAEETSASITAKFPRCKWVANTFRFDDHKGLQYYATLYAVKKLHISPMFCSTETVNKIGSGDCFMAGLIFGLLNGKPLQQIVNFATAAAFNKLFIPSDCTTATVADIEQTKSTNEK